jgi:hypothetical protein
MATRYAAWIQEQLGERFYLSNGMVFDTPAEAESYGQELQAIRHAAAHTVRPVEPTPAWVTEIIAIKPWCHHRSTAWQAVNQMDEHGRPQ